MTGKERITNILQRKPVDRIGIFEHYCDDTLDRWSGQGHIAAEKDLNDHFGHDMQRNYFYFNMIADIDFEPQTVEETEETLLIRDGNGALLRKHKQHDTTPEHVDFLVKERAAWEEHIKWRLNPDPRRINFEEYRCQKRTAAAAGHFFCWSGPNVFELMHPVCGFIEPLLPGMIEAGIDCLQVLEVKAGMDPFRVHRDYGHCLSLMGGIDVRVLYSNNREFIDHELESKIPILKKGFGYVLHSDHSIPNTVEYDNYCYFLERGMELGSY